MRNNLIFIFAVMIIATFLDIGLSSAEESIAGQREKEKIKEAINYTNSFIGKCSRLEENLDDYNKLKYKWRDPKEISNDVRKIKTRVIATIYHPIGKQCDNNPLITADGSKISMRKLKNKQLKWIAVSRDLRSTYRYGDVVKVIVKKGDKSIEGEYEVHDTMNPRFTNRIDILSHPDSKLLGRWDHVEIIKEV